MAMDNNSAVEILVRTIHERVSFRTPSYQFLWVLQGTFCYKTGEKKLQIEQNGVILIFPGTEYTLDVEKENCLLCITIRRGFFEKGKSVRLGYFVCNSVEDQDRDYSMIRKLLSQMAISYFDDAKDSEFLLYSYMYSLLYYLNRYHYVETDLKTEHQLSEKNIIRYRAIVEYIERNYKEPISLQDLSDEFFLTPQYLSRLFNRCFGQNFVSYINEIRLFHVADDLLESDNTILFIATENGFSSVSTFNKLFKSYYHLTPSQYREKYKYFQRIDTKQSEKYSKAIFEYSKNYLQQYAQQELPALDSIAHAKKNEYTIQNPLNGKPFSAIWNSMVNIGFSSNIGNSALISHLKMAQKEIGFKYGRLQAILNNSLLWLNPETGEYNFSDFDWFIQFMLSIGIKPFLDLTFKASRLLSHSKNQASKKNADGYLEPNREQFMEKILAIVKHCINVFGQMEVETWKLEIGYWHDESLHLVETVEEFVTRFQIAYTQLKAMLPNIQVGGISHNASLPLRLFEHILNEMAHREFSPDFISFVIFPYNSIMPPGQTENYVISPNPDLTLMEIKKFSSCMEKYKNITKKVILSVFAMDLSSRNYINDSCYNGAFLVKNTLDIIGKVEVMGYWQLSDICNAYYDSNRLLFGGNGIISQHGLRKSSFMVLKRLGHSLPNLVDKGNNYLITSDNRNVIYVVIHNYVHFSKQYSLNRGIRMQPNETYTAFEGQENFDISLNFQNLPAGSYRITTSILNRDCGSILDEWLKYGLTERIYPTDIQYFENMVHALRQVRYYECENGCMSLHVQLLPHEVRFVEITRELS